jgi:hypothetical protein
MTESELLEKLRKVERLHAAAATDGERAAAGSAMERIRERLAGMKRQEPEIEHKFNLQDDYGLRLFIALAHRYGLRVYRKPRMRHTSACVRAPKRFVDEVLWPEFLELVPTLVRYLDEAAERVIGQVFGKKE